MGGRRMMRDEEERGALGRRVLLAEIRCGGACAARPRSLLLSSLAAALTPLHGRALGARPQLHWLYSFPFTFKIGYPFEFWVIRSPVWVNGPPSWEIQRSLLWTRHRYSVEPLPLP